MSAYEIRMIEIEQRDFRTLPYTIEANKEANQKDGYELIKVEVMTENLGKEGYLKIYLHFYNKQIQENLFQKLLRKIS